MSRIVRFFLLLPINLTFLVFRRRLWLQQRGLPPSKRTLQRDQGLHGRVRREQLRRRQDQRRHLSQRISGNIEHEESHHRLGQYIRYLHRQSRRIRNDDVGQNSYSTEMVRQSTHLLQSKGKISTESLKHINFKSKLLFCVFKKRQFNALNDL